MNEEVGEHDINEEYNTAELDSNVESDEDVRLKMGNFQKYRQDDIDKNFKFEFGMEFCSLKEFKNALMEHNVLNGKELKFVKNDLNRVKAVCKNNRGFLIMASNVGGKETFRVKTLVGRHRCGRVFGNKSANVNWIAQVLVDMFVNVDNMKVNEIIDGIKKSFSIGISAWKAGKAKQIALDSLVGVENNNIVVYMIMLCLRHLHKNYKKKFGGGVLIRDLMMGSVKATFQQDWEKNGFATLREKAKTYPGDVMPKPRKRLDREVEKSGNWIPVWAGAAKFEVTHGFTMDKFVVDLSNHSCSCYFWDLVGIPCRHGMAAINYKVQNPKQYVHPYYKKQAYETCYRLEIVPINGQQLWSTSGSRALMPPIYKTPLGRPKKLRRREDDEYNTRDTSSVGRSGSSRGTSTTGGSEAQAAPSTSQ
ncbi:uncharacterized protein LOC124840131, partial [Vigna umbellata]|uniref:uncharacterized protein LOC124840131 n=1 Tax=Vigna umbellata TaxID=87088 RepID=UPI001F5F0804